MKRWKGRAIAACVVAVAQLVTIPGLGQAHGAHADSTASQTYYCITNLPEGSPWPGKRYDPYPNPQPGLQCYTNENEAYHYAIDPFFWCVTDGSDGWQVTAYNYPQQEQTCFWTLSEAFKSLPSTVQQIVPPGGTVDANACRISANAADPRQWGHWYFVRCTTPDQWGHARIQGAVSFHPVNGAPTVSDGPAPITDLSTWTEPGTPPSWTPASATIDTTLPAGTPTTGSSASPGAAQTPAALPPVSGSPSLLTAAQAIADGYALLSQPHADLISLRYETANKVWIVKFVGACSRTERSCSPKMGTYIEQSATNGKILTFHSIRFYKTIPSTQRTISVVHAIKAARAVLQSNGGLSELRVTSATLQQLSSGPHSRDVVWTVTFAPPNGDGTGDLRIVLNTTDGRPMSNP